MIVQKTNETLIIGGDLMKKSLSAILTNTYLVVGIVKPATKEAQAITFVKIYPKWKADFIR